jgi:Leucine-rich repeat (LRR) protein
MDIIKIFILFLLQLFIFIFGKDCISSENNPTSIICSEAEHILTNLTYYLSNFSNITKLSIIDSYLTEMPDIYQNNQLTSLHLDNNHIQLINRNYSTLENLSLTSNHIYILHETNLYYPKLKFLDLSHNPIEHIVETFFSEIQFPQLQILKLTNALTHINPFLIDTRLLSFSPLKYLNEIYMDENNFQEFPCSNNTTNIHWELPLTIQKVSLGKNRLISIDKNCFSSLLNLTQLDLSNNQLNLKDTKSNKQDLLPSTLRILYLNSMTNDLPCLLFDNLIELEQLHLEHLSSNQLEKCIFKKLLKLKTVC